MDVPMVQAALRGLPPVLATLMAPWLEAVELAGPGMGGRVSAIALQASSGLRRRVVPTIRLERAISEACAATEALAAALDAGALAPFLRRSTAREALVELTVWLRRAEPNAATKGLGLGW